MGPGAPGGGGRGGGGGLKLNRQDVTQLGARTALATPPHSQECLPHDSTDNRAYTHHTLCAHTLTQFT